MQPDFTHDIVEELHDWYATVRVILQELGKDTGTEEWSAMKIEKMGLEDKLRTMSLKQLIFFCLNRTASDDTYLHLGPASFATFKKSS